VLIYDYVGSVFSYSGSLPVNCLCLNKLDASTRSESDFYRDWEDCNQYAQSTNPSRASAYNPNLDPFQQAQAGIANGSANMARAFGVQSSFENCMFGKGYRKVQK